MDRNFSASLASCSDKIDAEAEALAKELEEAAENIVQEFEQGMAQIMDNLEKAQLAFDDLSGRTEQFMCVSFPGSPSLNRHQC